MASDNKALHQVPHARVRGVLNGQNSAKTLVDCGAQVARGEPIHDGQAVARRRECAVPST